MTIKTVSAFKDPKKAENFFKNWYAQIADHTKTEYEKIEVESTLGKTIVWGINTDKKDLKSLVIFPGFRTCGFFWDMDNQLENLKKKYRIFLVDVNGQPCLSDGNAPAIKTNDYGLWAADLMKKLSIKSATVAGASFGGLVCMKLALVAPEMVEKVLMMNPGCLQPFSLSLKNLYYNMLPIISPSEKNVVKFLDNAVLYPPHHQPSAIAKKLLIDYEVFALKEYKDKTEKPYQMSESDFNHVKLPVYLLLGDKDLLFPTKKSKETAEKQIKSLVKTYILKNTGHGIETTREAMDIMEEIMDL